MSKRKSVVITTRFIDLYGSVIPDLYHIIKESNRTISEARSNGSGLGVPISRPPGTVLIVSVKNPITNEMRVVKRFNMPSKKGTIEIIAPFSIQTIKLRKLADSKGNYSRKTYKVMPGDDLYSIAKKHNTTWQVLYNLNKDKISNSDKIFPGQWLKIPPKNSGLRGLSNSKPPPSSSQETYKLEQGDTLWDISQDTGVSVNELKRINNISNPTTLKAGQTIKIRDTETPGVNKKPNSPSSHNPSINNNDSDSKNKDDRYTVKSGDSLSRIANKYGVSAKAISAANGISYDSIIHPGQKLKIPKGSSGRNSRPSSSPVNKSRSPIQIKTDDDSSEDGAPKTIISSDESCVCKAYDLIWGAKVNCEFRKKVIEICRDLWPDDYLNMANNLMAVFAWESGEKFKSDAPNKQNSRATGLIQFMPDTYEGLTGEKPIIETVENYWGNGKRLGRIKQLAEMDEINQLDLVKKYFEPKRDQKLEFIDFYLQVLFPISSGKPDHVVFADSHRKLDFPNEREEIRNKRVEKFSRNNMDKNNDGKVMKSEIAQSVEHFLTDGEEYKSFGSCETFNVIEQPVSTNYNCPSNIEGCFCNRNNKLPMQVGFLTHSRIIKHHTPKLERRDYTQKIRKIILHRTVNSSAQSTFNSFSRGSKPYGTHFVVDKDGKIYQTANLNKLTIHAGNANPYSVGIEVVGMPLDKNGKPTVGPPHGNKVHSWQKLTIRQTQSVACLTKYLLIHYGLTQSNIAVHEDVAAKTEGEGRTVYNAIKEYL